MLQVKLVRSPIGNTKRNRATVAALGLRKMHQTVVLPDNESIRGMIFKVKHMLAVEVVEGDSAARVTSKPKRARTGEGAKSTRRRAAKGEATAKPAEETAKSAKTDKPKESQETQAPKDEKPKAVAKPKSQSKPKTEAKPKAEAKTAKPKAAKPKAAAKKKES